MYTIDPKRCIHCSQILKYEHRHRLFCNSSCSAACNNAKRKIIYTNICVYCNNSISSKGKYCNNKCQNDHIFSLKIKQWLDENQAPGLGAIRRYLKETFGYKCTECGISDYNSKPITLELEHKDGNSDNNALENLCLLCPNCHSQTPTYKAKNKGNGRHTRRQRYAEGKSY